MNKIKLAVKQKTGQKDYAMRLNQFEKVVKDYIQVDKINLFEKERVNRF